MFVIKTSFVLYLLDRLFWLILEKSKYAVLGTGHCQLVGLIEVGCFDCHVSVAEKPVEFSAGKFLKVMGGEAIL